MASGAVTLEEATTVEMDGIKVGGGGCNGDSSGGMGRGSGGGYEGGGNLLYLLSSRRLAETAQYCEG